MTTYAQYKVSRFDSHSFKAQTKYALFFCLKYCYFSALLTNGCFIVSEKKRWGCCIILSTQGQYVQRYIRLGITIKKNENEIRYTK